MAYIIYIYIYKTTCKKVLYFVN